MKASGVSPYTSLKIGLMLYLSIPISLQMLSMLLPSFSSFSSSP